jgi:hypothetical protein
VPGSKIIHFGELQGRIAIEVDLDGRDLSDETALVQAVLHARVPGAVAVELRNAPWGSGALDRALTVMAADARTEGLVVWAMRQVNATSWSSGPIWWVFDASALFMAEVSAAALVNAINSLPFLPPPSEVALVSPALGALSAVLLDELSTRLDAQGWIYVERGSEEWAVAEREIARAATPWGLRGLPGA